MRVTGELVSTNRREASLRIRLASGSVVKHEAAGRCAQYIKAGRIEGLVGSHVAVLINEGGSGAGKVGFVNKLPKCHELLRQRRVEQDALGQRLHELRERITRAKQEKAAAQQRLADLEAEVHELLNQEDPTPEKIEAAEEELAEIEWQRDSVSLAAEALAEELYGSEDEAAAE